MKYTLITAAAIFAGAAQAGGIYTEIESNDSIATSNFIGAFSAPGGSVAVDAVLSLDDVDWYGFSVSNTATLSFFASFSNGLGADGVMQIVDSTGDVLAFDDDSGVGLLPAIQISNLAAGTYYLSVGGGGGANNTGQYDLTVRIVTPIGDIPGRMMALKIGDPQWQVSDFVQFTGPLDAAAAVPFSVGLNPLFNPMHSPATGTGLGVLMTTDTPHLTDYSVELRTAMGMRGKANGATFPAADIIDPGAMYVGFSISPTATATTGSSGDFMDGPILPQSVYPLAIELDFEVGGMAIPELHTEYTIVYGGGSSVDGSSHEHAFAAVRANAGTPPADLVADYSWEYTVLDSNSEGYTFSIPFTLQ
ncbi:MAG: PPC domain-containing protein [Phycisphaerales bacterium]|nr:PPC domain-containing protein [Phycisphaerales bacterium]